MTKEELIALFDKHGDEHGKFGDVPIKQSQRPDLCAFLMLACIVPGVGDIIAGAEHDEIYLSPTIEDLAPRITESQVIDLIRCGVRYSRANDGLAMFV